MFSLRVVCLLRLENNFTLSLSENRLVWTLFLDPLVSGRNLGRSHLAETHVRILLATEAFKSLNTQDKSDRLHGGRRPSIIHMVLLGRSLESLPTPVGLPTALEEIRCRTSPAVCTRLPAMPDTPWKVQSFLVPQRILYIYQSWTSDRLGDDFWLFPYFCTMRGSTVDSGTYVSPGGFRTISTFFHVTYLGDDFT